ncbi:MAG: UPF0158 family protein [Methanothrix sp.]|nr:UPF0158 family protein [Methanothrix sp.]
MTTFDEIYDAFLFVSSDSCGTNRALLCLDNGEIYYHSEDGVFDELDEDEFDCDNFLVIPHKNDLDLGHTLVAEFVKQHMPSDIGRVQDIFSRRGAYSRFKDLLDHRGLLEKWYDFEKRRDEEALREWCRENKVKLTPA